MPSITQQSVASNSKSKGKNVLPIMRSVGAPGHNRVNSLDIVSQGKNITGGSSAFQEFDSPTALRTGRNRDTNVMFQSLDPQQTSNNRRSQIVETGMAGVMAS